MRKLVRDKIPKIIRNNNQSCEIEILQNDDDYFNALKNKLKEEVEEFIEATTENNNIEAQREIADIFEVIDAICEFKNYNGKLINQYKSEKFKERGGFKKRILLIKD
jgi:predicted house-cleaning noncanonical NTP pyrophosphatase (MazG superfamily)